MFKWLFTIRNLGYYSNTCNYWVNRTAFGCLHKFKCFHVLCMMFLTFQIECKSIWNCANYCKLLYKPKCYVLNEMQAIATLSLSSTTIACLLMFCTILYNNYLYHFSTTTGNFGVVNKAWYETENIQVKVAIKTLKGKFY